MKGRLKYIGLAGIITAVMCATIMVSNYFVCMTNAQGILTGLETKVSEKVNTEDDYKVVEVIPDGSGGEFVHLVDGYVTDAIDNLANQYLDYYVNTLGNPNGPSARQACIEMYEQAVLSQYTGDNPDFSKPYTKYQGYEEEYFRQDMEGWYILELWESNYEYTTLRGHYEEAPTDGIYTPNVQSFTYDADNGSYEIKFTYGEPAADAEGAYKQRYRADGTDANGNVMCVPAEDDYTGSVYHITSYRYVGSSSANALYKINELDAEKPYSYDSQNGTYTFVMNEEEDEHYLEIGRVYYTYGVWNNDWFRKKVLASKDSDALAISVETITESQLLEGYSLDDADFIYICGDTLMSGLTYQDTQGVADAIRSAMVDSKKPCMVDASTGVAEKLDADYIAAYNSQNEFIYQNLFICGTKDASQRKAFFTDFETTISETDHLTEVKDFITEENLLRTDTDESSKLSSDLNRAFLMQYIINYSHKRSNPVKQTIRVLEVEPCDAYTADASGFTLTTDTVSQWTGVSAANIEIERMSSSAFIGKIEDMNTEYDLVYFGANISRFNQSNGTTAYNDSAMNGLIYAHTGDYALGKASLMGSLDTDYAGAYAFRRKGKYYARKNNYLLYNYYEYQPLLIVYTDWYMKYRSQMKDGKLVQHLYKFDEEIPVNEARNIYTDGSENRIGDIGVFRYSGNDITKTKLQDVMEYVQAKYPIVVADTYYNSGTDRANRTVNTTVVDNTSYMYQLLDNVKTNENVYTVSQANAADSALKSYANINKIDLLYFNPSSPDVLEAYQGISTEQGDSFRDESTMIIDKSSSDAYGVYKLRTYFNIQSNVDDSASTYYIPKLYLDLNNDGKFLGKGTDDTTEIMNGSTVYYYDAGAKNGLGKEATYQDGQYRLQSNTSYVIEMNMPDSYLGMIAWKLEVVKGNNSNIRTSDVQYTKIDGVVSEREVVKVLQIGDNDDENCNLSEHELMQSCFDEIRSDTAMDFQITYHTTAEVDGWSASSGDDFYEKYLKDYDMIIIGFADTFSNLSSQNAIQGILKHINNGKSILLSHDTTSYRNTTSDYHGQTINKNDKAGSSTWGKDFNIYFRSILAMDRYGLEYPNQDLPDDEEEELLNDQSDALKQGENLTVNMADRTFTVNQCYDAVDEKYVDFLTRGIRSGQLSENRDIAYAANTKDADGYAQTYSSTQGLSNGIIDRYMGKSFKSWSNPYGSLAGVEYGTGTSCTEEALITAVNDGKIMHYPYEIGSSFHSENTHFQYYQLDMDRDVDGEEGGDVVVWYCLSGDEYKTYSYNRNDVRNNYYIYNVGNVTYTGMGHDSLGDNEIETKLFVNTIVAAYMAAVQEPTIRLIDGDNRVSEKNYEYITYDKAMTGSVDTSGNEASSDTAISNDVTFNFVLADPNLTTDRKEFELTFSYDVGDGKVAVNSSDVIIRDLTTGEEYTGTFRDYNESHVYQATIPDLGQVMRDEDASEMTIYIDVTSRFTYYGSEVQPTTSTSLEILRTRLFDLN